MIVSGRTIAVALPMERAHPGSIRTSAMEGYLHGLGSC